MKYMTERCIKLGEVDEEGLLEISNSRMKRWNHCQRSHDYRYVDKIKPRKKVRALSLGGLVHNCLEARDTGEEFINVIRKYKKEEFDKLFEEERAELGNIPQDALRIMRAYVNHYKLVDEEWETIACEQDFMIRVPGTKIVITGKIDKIARHKKTGKVWCFEHKTMKKGLPTESFRTTDTQTAIYCWVMMMLAPYLGYHKKDVEGVMFDYLRTKPPTVPQLLKNGTMSKRKLDTDKWTYIEALKKAGLDPADYQDHIDTIESSDYFIRIPMAKSKAIMSCMSQLIINTAHQILKISNTPLVTRNLSYTCDRPKCEYRDLCLAEMQGLDTSSIISLYYTKGDEDNGKERDEEETE